MKNLIEFGRGYCDAATGTDGGEGGGNPAGTSAGAVQGADGGDGAAGSAFAQKTGAPEPSGGTAPADPPSAGQGETAKAGSAFSQKAGAADGGEGREPKEPTREELASMTDEDWARGVLPEDKDADGNETDRTFMTAMAKTCREAGISPRQMRTMSDRFQELAKAEMDAQEARAAEEAKALDAANAAATKAAVEKFDDRQWADIRTAGAKYIPAGSELARLMEGPLGSNIELLTILNVVGKSLRSAAPDTTAAGGTGENDPALAVVQKTCGVAFGNK